MSLDAGKPPEPRAVFITGASSGLGEGFAVHYAALGATVGLVARRSDRLEALAARLGARGVSVHTYTADVADTRAMRAAADDFERRSGGADLVIANAGIGLRGTPSGEQAGRVALLMNTNVVGVTNTVLPFAEGMRARGRGVLVAVSSVAGHRALPRSTAYSASKAAVIVFMDGLRMDLHGTGVHAMTLCPGFVRTELTAESSTPMPFLMDCDLAVQKMARAIERRRDTYTFPWQMNLIKHVMRRAPEWVLRRWAQ